MKYLNISVMALVIGISVTYVSCVTGDSNSVKGNGNLITSEESASPFEKINISGGAEVRFHASQEYRTVVTVDSNLLDYIEIVTKGNTLNIGTKVGNYSFTKYSVDVYCPIVTSVSVSGSGRFKSTDNINVSTFSAAISGSGNITVTGSGSNANIEISGSGTFSGNEFNINTATVRVNGSGRVIVNVSDDLTANISGSGEINYRGNPRINSNISGSGRIRKL